MSQTVLGILSDTHGLLRPQVLELLSGSDLILHGGDVGEGAILEPLRGLAPVIAVRGNTDNHGAAAELPFTAQGKAGPLQFHMVHRREDIDPQWPKNPGLIVFGHSHQPEIEWRGRCLLLNPGACGRRRFHLPLTVARVTIDVQGRMVPEVFRVE